MGKYFFVDSFNTIGFMSINKGNSVADAKILVEMGDNLRSEIRTGITGKRVDESISGKMSHKALG